MTSNPTFQQSLSRVRFHARFALFSSIIALIFLFHPRNQQDFTSFPAFAAAGQGGGTTHTLFLPLIEKPYPTGRPMGNVAQRSGPEACGNGTCYEIEISCPEVSQPRQATLRVTSPPDPPASGTILFATGWTGTYFWAGDNLAAAEFLSFDQFAPLMANALENNALILDRLIEIGFRTVEVKWDSSWWYSNNNSNGEGFGRLACRPATMIQWVHDNLHVEARTAPYCAAGHSNGASQVAYALSHYRQVDVLDAVLLESGPNWSRVDQACLHTDPVYSSVFEDLNGRKIIDLGFGQASNGSGRCANQDPNAGQDFEDASLAFGDRRFYLPKTRMAFIFGSLDTTTTMAQGEVYYDTLVKAGSPLVTRETIVGAPHWITSVEAGKDAVQQTLIDICQ